MISRHESLLANVAVLYYRDGLNQSEIAKRMGVSRATIVSYLRQARELQIVDIRISGMSFATSRLASSLKERFGLADVFIAEPGEALAIGEDDRLHHVATVGAMALLDILQPNDVLGVSWGRTIHMLSEELPIQKIPGLTICQVVGSMHVPSLTAAEACAIRISGKTDAACFTLHAPAIVSTPELAEALRSEGVIRRQLERFKTINRVLFSVGGCDDDTQLLQSGIGRVEDLQWYTARGAKGIVCGRFIDGEGRHLVGPLDKRMIGITPDELRACSGILVAAGREKVTAIRAALAGGLVSHLVVDLEIGSLLLAT